MGAWFVDRMLPGLASGLLVATAVAVEHILMRRLTRQQTTELKASREGGDAET